MISLGFLHGAVLMLIAVLFVNARYEDDLYDQLVAVTIEAGMDSQEQVLALMHAAHEALAPRQELFEGEERIAPRGTWFRSADVQLIDGKEACGSYTHVLGRMLQRAGYTIRVAQMKCEGVWACHILLEVEIDGAWAVLDPLQDVAFKKPDGRLASFEDVQRDWDTYRRELPPTYIFDYDYEDVRYTNWEKVPLVMPMVREGLRLVLGYQVDTLSLRSYVLNVYRTYGIILALLYALLLVVSVVEVTRYARQPQPG